MLSDEEYLVNLKKRFDPSYSRVEEKTVNDRIEEIFLFIYQKIIFGGIYMTVYYLYHIVAFLKIAFEIKKAKKEGFDAGFWQGTHAMKTLRFPTKKSIWQDKKDFIDLLLLEPQRINAYTTWKVKKYANDEHELVREYVKKVLEKFSEKSNVY